MKANKIVLNGFVITLLILLVACGSNKTAADKDTLKNNGKNDSVSHVQHESLQQNFAHKGIIILKNPYILGKQNEGQLKKVIDDYLAMKNAFIVSDGKGVDSAATAMRDHVKAVDSETMNGEGKEAWLQHASGYNTKLTELLHITGIEEKRTYLSHLSEIVYCTKKSFKLKEMQLFAVYCPMAFNGKGAYWISETEKIRNPYFGEKMMDCGSIEEKL